ncbi:MAG: hypothetical protein HeimAB125_08190 [Candidatus Heimdallarchaeota archaeon AB_125]|nr:MAG: hypothetical protein HeimAB125_08190 [Candidatus Heimdallarchaeota archaeon AB_125]
MICKLTIIYIRVCPYLSGTMDTITNIIFRSLTAIYEGTISGNVLHPNLYFLDNNKKNTFYGFNLQEVIPTRLILRIYEDGKKIITDLLWLVDDSKINGKGNISFTVKSNKIVVEGEPKDYIKLIQDDATINACYEDLLVFPDYLDLVLVGSRDWSPDKIQSITKLNIPNIPTNLYGFSRTVLDAKKIKDEDYQDSAINSYLALVDLIHRSLELLSKYFQKENGGIVFCVRCGQELPSSSYYCPICGSKQN